MTKTAIAIALFLGSAQFALACDYPSRPKIVDGATATRDEMVESQAAVKTYISLSNAYLECLEKEEQAALEAATDLDAEARKEREDAFNRRYNAAVDEQEIIANAFNEQVQVFRARDE